MDWEEKPRFPVPPGSVLEDLPLTWQGKEVCRVPGRVNLFLREYQRDGVRFLWDRFCRDGGAILADDMGLGKTVQIIALLSALYDKTGFVSDHDANRLVVTGDKPVDVSLIVCPSSVLTNWEEEIRTWGNFVTKKFYKSERDETLRTARAGRCEIVLSSFETVREHVSDLNQVKWKMVVVDECHRIKEPSAALTGALKSIGCRRRTGLTGTALQNRYNELWCLLDWANPGCLGSSKHFEAEFSVPMTKGFRFDATKLELAAAREKQTRLNELKRAWMIRRTKSRTIKDQLPTKKDQVVFCSLSPLQLSLMLGLASHPDTQLVLKAWERCVCGNKMPRILCCWKKITNKDGTSPRTLLLQLIHVFIKASNHAALLLPGHSAAQSQTNLGIEVCQQVFKDRPKLLEGWKTGKFVEMADTALSGKMMVLSGLLHVMEAQGDKVLLFSYSTRVLDILSLFLDSKGYSHRRLDGNTKTEIRQKLVNEFNTDQSIFVFLVSTKAGGVGLNITGANNVIIFDPNWNPSHDLQAQDRAYRIGQLRDVNVYRLVSVGCIEEIIYLRQVYKQQLAASSVDGETARRYFLAVQGDSRRRGELFGVRNLFRVDPTGQCLTAGIEQRNREMEEKVRGRVRGSGLRIQDNLLLERTEQAEEDQQDPFNIGLAAELAGAEEPESIDQVLARGGVVYSHANQGVVGASRAEQHISECAIKDVESGSCSGAGHLPADQCDPLLQTQGLLLEPELGYQPHSAGNKPRTIKVGDKEFVYGDTPAEERRNIFLQIAAKLGQEPVELARRVERMDFSSRLNMLQQYHESVGSERSVLQLLERAREEDRREMKDETLRKISYYHPSVNNFSVISKSKRPGLQRNSPVKKMKVETEVRGILSVQKTKNTSNRTDINQLNRATTSSHKKHIGPEKTSVMANNEDLFSDGDEQLTRLVRKDEFSDDDILQTLEPKERPIKPRNPPIILTESKPSSSEDDVAVSTFAERRRAIKPAPPGQFYKSSRRPLEKVEPRDELDEIFDDSVDLNKIFERDLKPSRSVVSGASPRTVNTNHPSQSSNPNLPRLDRFDASFDTSGDSLLDQIFPSP